MTGSIPSRIVVVLAPKPVLDIHPIAARAAREGRCLMLLPLGTRVTPEQDAVIEVVAHLAWSWLEALTYGIAHGIESIDASDEVVIDSTDPERHAFDLAFESSLESLRVEQAQRLPRST